MKKVLILSYFWPYRGGSARTLGLVKYLPDFGWEPIIVTPPLGSRPPERYRVIETPEPGDVFTFWRQILKPFKFSPKESITEQMKEGIGGALSPSVLDYLRKVYLEIFAYPFAESRWTQLAYAAARDFIRTEKVDMILSVWPITTHLVARRLKKEFGVPWVADFPDPWSENHAYAYGRIRRWFDRKLEIRTLCSADVLTAASPGYAMKVQQTNSKPVTPITLGFDDAAPVITGQTELSRKFTITYTGAIYQGKQDPVKVLRAVRELLDEKAIAEGNIEILFYGKPQLSLETAIKQLLLEGVARQCGTLTKEESIQKQCQSQILLLLCWEDLEEKGVYPYKLFEYISARRPILATGGSQGEDVKAIIAETGAGASAVSISDIKIALKKFYSDFERNGAVQCESDTTKINQFTWRNMAGRFSKIFDTIGVK